MDTEMLTFYGVESLQLTITPGIFDMKTDFNTYLEPLTSWNVQKNTPFYGYRHEFEHELVFKTLDEALAARQKLYNEMKVKFLNQLDQLSTVQEALSFALENNISDAEDNYENYAWTREWLQQNA